MSKKKPDPWTKPRDVWSDDKLLDELGKAHKAGPPSKGGGGKSSGCALLIIAGAAVSTALGEALRWLS